MAGRKDIIWRPTVPSLCDLLDKGTVLPDYIDLRMDPLDTKDRPRIGRYRCIFQFFKFGFKFLKSV